MATSVHADPVTGFLSRIERTWSMTSCGHRASPLLTAVSSGCSPRNVGTSFMTRKKAKSGMPMSYVSTP